MEDIDIRKIVRRREEQEIAKHQDERRARLGRVDTLAAFGKTPTHREYVTYHCYTFLSGREPLSYEKWVSSLQEG